MPPVCNLNALHACKHRRVFNAGLAQSLIDLALAQGDEPAAPRPPQRSVELAPERRQRQAG